MEHKTLNNLFVFTYIMSPVWYQISAHKKKAIQTNLY